MKISKQKLKNLQKAKKGIQNTTHSFSHTAYTFADTDFMLRQDKYKYHVKQNAMPDELALAHKDFAIKSFVKTPSYHDNRIQLIEHLHHDIVCTGIVSDIKILEDRNQIRICVNDPILNMYRTKMGLPWHDVPGGKYIGSHLWLSLFDLRAITHDVSYVSIGDAIAFSAYVDMYNYHNSKRQNIGVRMTALAKSGVPVPYRNDHSKYSRVLIKSQYPRKDDWIIRVHRGYTSKYLSDHSHELKKISSYFVPDMLSRDLNTWLEVKPSVYNSLNHPHNLDFASPTLIDDQINQRLQAWHIPKKYTVKRFQSMINNEIKLMSADARRAKDRHRAELINLYIACKKQIRRNLDDHIDHFDGIPVLLATPARTNKHHQRK